MHLKLLKKSTQIKQKMRNQLFLIAALVLLSCLTCTTCYAQKTSLNNAQLGIKGGINFSNMYTKDVDQNNMLTGFNIGVFAKMPVTNFLAIQPELYFTTKGAEVTYNNSFVDGTVKYRLNYVELPVLVMINLTKNFNLNFGPYAGYLISGVVKNQSSINLFDFENNINVDDFNRLEAGLTAGIGIDIKNVGIGMRYSYGLTKVGKEKTFTDVKYTFPDAKNSVLNFNVSFLLNSKKNHPPKG